LIETELQPPLLIRGPSEDELFPATALRKRKQGRSRRAARSHIPKYAILRQMQNLAIASDIRILLACADEDRQKIIARLIKEPATQKQLIAELGLNSGTISRHMRVLEDADLVLRDRSHSPYSLSASAETFQLLRANKNVTAAISKRRELDIEESGKDLQRAVMGSTEESARSSDG
jgi:DNA-binding transcriptional ArsR family regulator